MGSDYKDKTSLRTRRVHKKKCTDFFCFLIFLIFVAGMGLITALVAAGNGFERLIFGYDSDGNVCNNKQSQNTSELVNYYDTTGRGFVFYFNYSDPINARKVCVKACPSINIIDEEEFKNYTLSTNQTLCEYDVSPGVYIRKKCPKLPLIQTVPIANRCVPDIEQFLTSNILGHLKNTKYGKLFEEQLKNTTESFKLSIVKLYHSLPIICYIALASLLMTILLSFLLRYIAKVMVFIIMTITAAGCVAFSVFLWLRWWEIRQKNPSEMTTIIGFEVYLTTSFIIYSILMSIVSLIVIFLIIAMRKRIGLVVRLICEAQMTLFDMPVLFVLPVFTFLILAVFLIYWLLTAVMIYSYTQYNTKDLQFQSLSIKQNIVYNALWVYHAIALIWISEFIFACQAMVVSSSVAKWYFTRDKNNFSSPICSSICNLVVFQMGSVAIGSFIITLVRFPRYCLMAVQKKMKTLDKTSILYNCLKGLTCCLWCLEKVINYLNKNAYTIVAIEGVSFCVAAHKSFALIVKNALRVAMINSVGDFILFLCKLAIVILSVGLSMFWLGIPADNIKAIKGQLAPLFVIAVIAFLIANCFFTVYEMVIDALMICFCEDIEANDGSVERPYYMSKSLKAFVDETDSTIISVGQ